ncbi:hypothetical protein MKW94_005908 [Papaver nudicaule]|uniref:F-box domain-containing protein n=1 Tax=Papaver nudicaule TaxID=74823 RepID=A0AA41VP27_PAPNU|nr:hypothetical protein [Papaver nudicaule]
MERSTGVINTSCLGVCNSLDIIASSIPPVTDDVVVEILSRLPAKSLIRFKSVCKRWLSLIKQDQYLIDSHFNHSKSRPNLLYIDPLQEKGLLGHPSYATCFWASETLCQSIACAEIVQGSGCEDEEVEAIVSKVRITNDKWFRYDKVLAPVNGLVCFVDTKTHAVKVYNASTREETPWVKSTLLAEENYKLKKSEGSKVEIKARPVYHFGYDPQKKEYKVFCLWRLSATPQHHRWRSLECPDYARWEVLTVGRDTKWRKINMVPDENNKTIINEVLSPYGSGKQALYADGTLYWSNEARSNAPQDDPDVIVALDVGSEKYRVIPIPNFILDEPREKYSRHPIDMLMLGGRVALLFGMGPFFVKLWMLDDGINNKLENCQGNESNWSAETIHVPFYCHSGICGFGVAGSVEMIVFECSSYKNHEGDNAFFVSLYAYDFRKKSCKKIEVDGESSFILHSERSLITSFTENLYPICSHLEI